MKYLLSILLALSYTFAIGQTSIQDERYKIWEYFFDNNGNIIDMHPKNKLDNNIFEDNILFKSTHHNEVIINLPELKRLNSKYIVSKNDSITIIKNVDVGIIESNKITYKKLNLKMKSYYQQKNKCDNTHSLPDSIFVFNISNYSTVELFNTKGLILFRDKQMQNCFRRSVSIKKSLVQSPNPDIALEDLDEITYEEMLLLSWKGYEILCQINGVRNINETETWYLNEISIRKADTTYINVSTLSNIECLHGYLSGY